MIFSPSKFACQVQERFLKIVVALGRYFIVLKVLLPVKSDLLCLDLPILDINLVPTKNNGYILAHSEMKEIRGISQLENT